MTSTTSFTRDLKKEILINRRNAASVLSSDVAGELLEYAKPVDKNPDTVPSASAFDQLCVMYVLPPNTSAAEKWSFAKYLLCCGYSSSTNFMLFYNWLYTLAGFLYGSLFTNLLGKEYDRKLLTVLEVQAIHSAVSNLPNTTLAPTLTADERKEKHIQNAAFLFQEKITPLLPRPYLVMTEMATTPERNVLVYAYFGIICFAMIKDVTASGQSSLQVKRPAAIQQKYKITAKEYPYIGGSMAPSKKTFDMINRAWRELPGLRRNMFHYIARLSVSHTSGADDALHTTTSLMIWGDSAHIGFIIRMAVEFPMTLELEQLASDWKRFRAALKNLENTAAAVSAVASQNSGLTAVTGRDSRALIPYLKCILGDKMKSGLRADFEALLDLALGLLYRTDPNIAGYTGPQKYNNLVAVYDAYVKADTEYQTRLSEFQSAAAEIRQV